MADSQNRVVIVGAGQAGAWVATTLRELDPNRPIVLVGEEPHPPYERPPLSKSILAGTSSIQSAYIKPYEFYATNAIELWLNTTVSRINRNQRQIIFENGKSLRYGTLVLATGARARALTVPGANLKCVYTLRTAENAEMLRTLLISGKRVVVIGAGLIGLELAAAAIVAGCIVTVLDAFTGAMGRVVDPSVGKAITDMHRAKGVKFYFSETITEIVENGDGPEIVLGSGKRLSADLIVAGIGGIPNTELAIEAGIECTDGIRVDAFGRTSDPHIYAAGDITCHANPLLGRSLRLESWQNAQNQGIAIAKVIAGGDDPYSELPWFWTDQYDNNFQIIGAPEVWDRVIWRGAPQDAKYTVIYMNGARIVAANTLNNARDVRPLKVMILNHRSVGDSVLSDPATSLMKLAQS